LKSCISVLKVIPCSRGAAKLTTPSEAALHKVVTAAVHRHPGAKIAMQILHSGRYGYHPFNVAPSAIKAPIGLFTPKELSHQDVLDTVAAYARSASLAAEAGYDGVEIMGSEGYLINQFIATRTNKRTDAWGGVSRKEGGRGGMRNGVA
jgi:2,4-dienoyl-CoA reductase (NADPH2)